MSGIKVNKEVSLTNIVTWSMLIAVAIGGWTTLKNDVDHLYIDTKTHVAQEEKRMKELEDAAQERDIAIAELAVIVRERTEDRPE